MILPDNYIKKGLKWFVLLLAGIALSEYLILGVFTLEPMVQVFVQILIPVILIAVILRTS
jgi:hypothetical protein